MGRLFVNTQINAAALIRVAAHNQSFTVMSRTLILLCRQKFIINVLQLQLTGLSQNIAEFFLFVLNTSNIRCHLANLNLCSTNDQKRCTMLQKYED